MGREAEMYQSQVTVIAGRLHMFMCAKEIMR